ncbi:MAG: signal peptidase I [Bacteroidales bacterium]|nr:signal peptidase I [Bacteroidales bacterium]
MLNRKHNTRLFRSLRLDNILSGVLFLLAVILLAVFLRVFVFEIYSIPTGSMEETLLPGDRIVVSKLAYGAALPRSPLEVPWLNAFFLLNKQAIAANDTFVWRYRRLSGLSRLQREDVVVFRYPVDPHQTFIKRCVALPGDTVEVKQEILYVNSHAQPFPPTAKIEYKVWVCNPKAFKEYADSLRLLVRSCPARRDPACRIVALSRQEKTALWSSGTLDSLALYVIKRGDNNEAILLNAPEKEGNDPPDAYGPLVVPYEGMNIPVNETMMQKYGKVLERYEHFQPQPQPDSSWQWRGKPVEYYTFRQDYYFMMGDTRHNSTDSRWWGTVPEELITGKAKFILWSGNLKNFRWERVLKGIN